jgi:hypothetical protein
MMYKKNYVAAIKVNGKILRETGDEVSLPFGSEYSILLKNLNSVRSQVKIWIDGKDVTEGVNLVLPANSDFELERYIRNGNLNTGNKFKFIERTQSIEDSRGIKIDDGLIRIEFKQEKVYYVPIYHYYYDHYWPYTWRWDWNYPNTYPITPSITYGLSGLSSASSGSMNSAVSGLRANLSTNQNFQNINCNGITAPGSESNQQLYTVSGFPVEDQSEVVVLKLVGRRGKIEIAKPITVDLKPKCSTCNRTNKATSKFCSNCGTSLKII